MSSPAQQLAEHIQGQLSQALFGLDEASHGLSLALLAGGHVLLQGVPGLGKTLLAKQFASVLGGSFKRVQCTADLMPSDITGIHVLRDGGFEFAPGPLFADVVLVDEINRSGPKTQSALLQAMEEGRVSIDRETYPLSDNFLLLASQNPADFEGTYPLPESQIDRFLLRLDLVYPEAEHELMVLKSYDRPGGGHRNDLLSLQPLPEGLLAAAREAAERVHCADALYDYALGLARASRSHPSIALGLSTRGALNLVRCARAEAALRGGEFVLPDDIKRVAPMVIGHRLLPTPEAQLEGVESGALVASLLEQVPVPRESHEDSPVGESAP